MSTASSVCTWTWTYPRSYPCPRPWPCSCPCIRDFHFLAGRQRSLQRRRHRHVAHIPLLHGFRDGAPQLPHTTWRRNADGERRAHSRSVSVGQQTGKRLWLPVSLAVAVIMALRSLPAACSCAACSSIRGCGP